MVLCKMCVRNIIIIIIVIIIITITITIVVIVIAITCSKQASSGYRGVWLSPGH